MRNDNAINVYLHYLSFFTFIRSTSETSVLTICRLAGLRRCLFANHYLINTSTLIKVFLATLADKNFLPANIALSVGVIIKHFSMEDNDGKHNLTKKKPEKGEDIIYTKIENKKNFFFFINKVKK